MPLKSLYSRAKGAIIGAVNVVLETVRDPIPEPIQPPAALTRAENRFQHSIQSCNESILAQFCTKVFQHVNTRYPCEEFKESLRGSKGAERKNGFLKLHKMVWSRLLAGAILNSVIAIIIKMQTGILAGELHRTKKASLGDFSVLNEQLTEFYDLLVQSKLDSLLDVVDDVVAEQLADARLTVVLHKKEICAIVSAIMDALSASQFHTVFVGAISDAITHVCAKSPLTKHLVFSVFEDIVDTQLFSSCIWTNLHAVANVAKQVLVTSTSKEEMATALWIATIGTASHTLEETSTMQPSTPSATTSPLALSSSLFLCTPAPLATNAMCAVCFRAAAHIS